MLKAQQGDVLFKVSEIPSGAAKKVGTILKSSQATGHAHSFVGKGVLYLHGGKVYLKANAPVRIKHQEHKAFTLPKGTYLVDEVQEYDHWSEEARAVQD